jgi:hypothetical protein
MLVLIDILHLRSWPQSSLFVYGGSDVRTFIISAEREGCVSIIKDTTKNDTLIKGDLVCAE